MQTFYPKYIDKIWHYGKAGNKYRLDSFDKILRLQERIASDTNFKIHTVNEKDDSVFHLMHSEKLIESYKTGIPRELAESSGFQWQKDFYGWLLNATWAHIYSAKAALEYGYGLTLSNEGGHHAEFDRGLGFCPVNNLVITSRYLFNNGLANKVAILDTDIHFGNGTHSLVKDDPRILSCDIWKYKLEHWEYTPPGENIVHFQVQNAAEYFEKLDIVLNRIKDFKPDIVIYYLGLDVLNTDRMSGIENFDEDALKKRTKMVGEFLRKNKMPVTIALGGGYINYQKSQEEIKNQRVDLVRMFYESIKETLIP